MRIRRPPPAADDVGVTASSPLPCPHCATDLPIGAPACPSCGLRLVGPAAARLWQVTQQIAALRSEADSLVQVLLVPAAAGERAAAYAVAPTPDDPSPDDRTRPSSRAARGPSGQQVLLGLGALLLLSAAAFFLLVVWFVVGLAGQALIMVTLTAAAVAGSAVATRRRLHAAAETAAVVATGLLTLDLAAAHWLDLAGLGHLATDAYWAGAGLLGGVLLLGFDRLVPRTHDGAALRRVLVHRPAATSMLAVAGWSAVAAADPAPVALCGLALLLAVGSGAGAWAAYRLDHAAPALRVSWSSVPLLVSAVVALATHVLTGLGVGYGPGSSVLEAYGAAALLLVVPVAALLLGDRVAGLLWPAAVAWLVPVVGIPLLDAPRLVVVAVSVVLGAVLAVAAVRRVLPDRPWATAVTAVAWAAQPALLLLVLALSEEGASTGRLLAAGVTDAPPAGWLLPVVPALAWSLPAVIAAVRARSLLWVALAETAVAATAFTALRDSEAVVWWPVALVLVAGNAAVGSTCARARGSHRGVEGAALGFGTLWAVTAVLAAGEAPYQLAAVLVTLGVVTLAYAASPGRLPVAYLGSLTVSAGLWVLQWEADVTTVEAFTAPLVVLLAGIGRVQWSRDHRLPTFLTAGPALSAALVPSTMLAVAEGSAVRLAVVTAAAVVVLGTGLLRSWQAPVTVGGVVLVVVAITQGGPLASYVPGWAVMGASGAALLAAGVAWERAVLAGRRANAWYGTLR